MRDYWPLTAAKTGGGGTLFSSGLLIWFLLGGNCKASRGEVSAPMCVSVDVSECVSVCGSAEVTGLRVDIIRNFRAAFRKIASFPLLVFLSPFISLLR